MISNFERQVIVIFIEIYMYIYIYIYIYVCVCVCVCVCVRVCVCEQLEGHSGCQYDFPLLPMLIILNDKPYEVY